ncbi:chromosome segregation protein SMC [Bacillus sp. GB_SG_008]|uniref:chromosome segregation protein SMC n=1 Tax=Bacillus sp. GB_SG_008 TaxID=3454627 RepID=UPI003F871C5E
MATERELELAKQILNKVTEMEKKVTKLGDSVKGLKNETLEVHTGLQTTFENGFRDVRKGLNELIGINKNRKSAREIVEGITGKDSK